MLAAHAADASLRPAAGTRTPRRTLGLMPDRSTAPAGYVRLQRVLADAGIAARRACETLISQGHVSVNGRVVRTLPVFVDPQADAIKVDGRPIPAPARHVYVMLNKPERVLVSAADEPGLDRSTVLDLVRHPSRARLFPVGRLDFHSSGMVLLTNDGELANRLSHPRFGALKTYHVTVKGSLSAAELPAIARALAAPAAPRAKEAPSPPRLRIASAAPGRTTLEITLSEAPNRQVRDVLGHLGLHVKRLERVAIGGVRLSGLARGDWRELRRDEIQSLRTGSKGTVPRRGRGGKTSDNRASTSPTPRHPKNQPDSDDAPGPRPRVIGA